MEHQMSFPNCLFLLEYCQTRSTKPLPPYPGDNLRRIHCYGLETSQKFHSSIEQRRRILHNSSSSLQHPWKTWIFSSREMEKKTLKTSPAVLQSSQPSPVFQNPARLLSQLPHLHGLLQHTLGTPFSAFADFLQKIIYRTVYTDKYESDKLNFRNKRKRNIYNILWYKQNFERLEQNEDKSKVSEDSRNVVSRTREWLCAMRKCTLQTLTEWLAVILFSPLLRSVPLFRIVDA